MTRRIPLLLLDLIAIGFAIVAFLQGGEADLLFHGVWVVLVIEAFAYGLRVTGPRIIISAIIVIAYAYLDETAGMHPLEVSDLLFTEWPLMFVIITMVAVMADRVITSNKAIAGLERRTHEELLSAREDERRRLSADLHDGLGQTLTALVLTLDAAESSLESETSDDGDTPRAAVARAQEIAALALEETHEVTRRLRPGRLQEIGLATAIRELAAHAGRTVEFEFDPRLATPRLLPVDNEMQVYRIVQEAVANAVRHARAQTISIAMHEVRGGRLQIEVHDDGDGFVAGVDSFGLGLRGMRERAAQIGATLSFDTAPGLGTRVRLQLPLRAAASVA